MRYKLSDHINSVHSDDVQRRLHLLAWHTKLLPLSQEARNGNTDNTLESLVLWNADIIRAQTEPRLGGTRPAPRAHLVGLDLRLQLKSDLLRRLSRPGFGAEPFWQSHCKIYGYRLQVLLLRLVQCVVRQSTSSLAGVNFADEYCTKLLCLCLCLCQACIADIMA
jgi:hypothetical protein